MLALSNCTVDMKCWEDDERVFTVHRNGVSVGEYHLDPIGSAVVAEDTEVVPIGNDKEVENTMEEAKAEPCQDLKKHEVEDSDDDKDGTVASGLDNEDTFENDRLPIDKQVGTKCAKALPKVCAEITVRADIKDKRYQKFLRKAQQNNKNIPGLKPVVQTPMQKASTNRQFKTKKTPQGDGNFIMYRDAVTAPTKTLSTLKQILYQRPKNLAFKWRPKRPAGGASLSIGGPMCSMFN